MSIYTADPGSGPIDISAAPVTDGGATFDSTGGGFTSTTVFTGTGDLTILAGGAEIDLIGNSTFVGDVYANSAIDIDNSGSLGADTNTLYLKQLMNVRSTTTHAQAIRIGANVRIQPASNGKTTTFSGNVTFDGNYRMQLGNAFNVADRNVTITGDITDGSFTNGRIDIDGNNSLFVFSGNNNYDGNTNVKDTGTRLNIDGTHTGGNLLVGGGAFLGGSGTIVFQDGMTINNAGTLDLASLLFDVSALTHTGSAITLVDYTGGSLSNTPANLQNVLTSNSEWALSDTGTLLQVSRIPGPRVTAARTLTITNADGSSEIYNINRDKFAGVRTMIVDGATVKVDHTAVPKPRDKETTFGGSQVITIKRDIEPLLTNVVGGASLALSLEDLNNKQKSTKVVRVRRSSDDTEKDFLAKDLIGDIAAPDAYVLSGAGTAAANGTYVRNGASSEGYPAYTLYDTDGVTALASLATQSFLGTEIWVIVVGLPNGGGSLYYRGVAAASSSTPPLSGWTVHFPTGTAPTPTVTQATGSTSALVDWVGAGNDGFVETLYDQSGEENHAFQPVASYQPKIVDAGVLITEGGLPAFYVDGVDDRLELTSAITNVGDFYVGYVSVMEETSGLQAILGANTNTNYLRVSDKRWQLYSGTGAGNTGTIAWSAPFNSRYLMSFNRSGSSVTVQLDGLAAGNGTNAADITTFTKLFLRSNSTSQLWKGKVQELIIYNSDQSANREAIETNINNRYEIY